MNPSGDAACYATFLEVVLYFQRWYYLFRDGTIFSEGYYVFIRILYFQKDTIFSERYYIFRRILYFQKDTIFSEGYYIFRGGTMFSEVILYYIFPFK